MRESNHAEKLGRGQQDEGGVRPISVREVGDGADAWDLAVSELRRLLGGAGSSAGQGGRGEARLRSAAEPWPKRVARVGLQEREGRQGRLDQNREREGKAKGFPFSFSFLEFSNQIFKRFRISFSNLVKATQYKRNNAPACMQQYVFNLIVEFKFTKVINSLCSMLT